MKKYSEITLNDDERKLLEVLKACGFTNLFRTSSALWARKGEAPSSYVDADISWAKTFYWMKECELYEIEKLLNPPHEPKTVWELEEGDEYWSVSAAGIVYKETWNNGFPDIECRSQGNVFLTREQAEFEKKRREVTAKVRKYTGPFNVWNYNWFPVYDYDDDEISKACNMSCRSIVDYFDSEEAINEAINEVGEDDFIDYYLGVVRR